MFEKRDHYSIKLPHLYTLIDPTVYITTFRVRFGHVDMYDKAHDIDGLTSIGGCHVGQHEAVHIETPMWTDLVQEDFVPCSDRQQ